MTDFAAARGARRRLLLTVGSTSFDALVCAFLAELAHWRAEFALLLVQCGRAAPATRAQLAALGFAALDAAQPTSASRETSRRQAAPRDAAREVAERADAGLFCCAFLPDLGALLPRFDFVLSHAGAGTVLELYRARVAFLCVPNAALADGHQAEIRDLLRRLRCGAFAALPPRGHARLFAAYRRSAQAARPAHSAAPSKRAPSPLAAYLNSFFDLSASPREPRERA